MIDSSKGLKTQNFDYLWITWILQGWHQMTPQFGATRTVVIVVLHSQLPSSSFYPLLCYLLGSFYSFSVVRRYMTVLLCRYRLISSSEVARGKPTIKLIINVLTYIIQVISLSGGAILRHNMVLAQHAMIFCPKLPRLNYSEPMAASL